MRTEQQTIKVSTEGAEIPLIAFDHPIVLLILLLVIILAFMYVVGKIYER